MIIDRFHPATIAEAMMRETITLVQKNLVGRQVTFRPEFTRYAKYTDPMTIQRISYDVSNKEFQALIYIVYLEEDWSDYGYEVDRSKPTGLWISLSMFKWGI